MSSWQHTRDDMLPFYRYLHHCFTLSVTVLLFIRLYISRGNPAPRRHTRVAPYTLLLRTLASGAGHFCQPLDIPIEVRLWLDPRVIERSLSLSRYGCLQRRCCACHGVTHSMVGAFTVSREVLRQRLLPEAPNVKRSRPG